MVLTRRFDEVGDFISSRFNIDGDGFKINSKIAAQPELYFSAKGDEKIKQLENSNGPHRGRNSNVAIH